MARAKKGGEIGANGEPYKGGQFINTIPENHKRHGSTPKKPRRVQIEPGVWVTDTRRPLFSIVGTGGQYVDRRDPSKGICPYAPAFFGGVMQCGKTLAEVQAICDRYNAGERFYEEAE